MAVFRSGFSGGRVCLRGSIFGCRPRPHGIMEGAGAHNAADMEQGKIVLCAQSDSVGAGCGRILAHGKFCGFQENPLPHVPPCAARRGTASPGSVKKLQFLMSGEGFFKFFLQNAPGKNGTPRFWELGAPGQRKHEENLHPPERFMILRGRGGASGNQEVAQAARGRHLGLALKERSLGGHLPRSCKKNGGRLSLGNDENPNNFRKNRKIFPVFELIINPMFRKK